jgi:hypothetical protein
MLTRVYINIMDRKLLTAEKILDNIEAIFKHISVSRKLEIVTDPKQRNECTYFSFDLLVKKFFVQKGILYTVFNKELEAQDLFLEGMVFGTKFYPRIRKESLKRLMAL